MSFRSFGVALSICATWVPAAWSQTRLQGIVFEDGNGNGIRESGEPGINGVVVSNQVDCVVTDEDGSYHIDVTRGYGIVFVSVPATHRAVGRFWTRLPSDSIPQSVDFALTPSPVPEEFSFIHASDTHLSERSLPRLRRLQEIVEDRKPAFVLITGDLIDDALRVPEEVARGHYQLYQVEVAAFTAPVYSVPGNHEIFGIERHHSLVSKDHPLYGKKMYREYLGPDYYSFQFGRLHFIAINSLDYDDLWYYGHVDETHLEWLEGELSHVPAGTSVVTFSHVPFFSSVASFWNADDDRFIQIGGERTYRHIVSNAREVLDRLSGFPYPLALAGHVHYRERLQLEIKGNPTRFYQAPAVIGPSDEKLHMPSGVILYRVRGGDIDDGEFIPLDEDVLGK